MSGKKIARFGTRGMSGILGILLLSSILFAEAANGPDLVGQWDNLKHDCKMVKEIPQCTIKGKFIVRNQGDTLAEGSRLIFFLSDDSAMQPEDAILQEIAVRSLKPGKTRKINVKFKLSPGTGSANQYVIGMVDADSFITETDESNNTAVFGPLPSGDEYFPFSVGSIWSYQGTITENEGAPTTYINTVKITGQHMIGDVLTTVFSETNSSNSGTPTEDYLLKDNVGITYYGGTETSAIASFPLIPFYQVLFPVKIKSAIKGSRQGIDTGMDLDGDGITEMADVKVKVTPTSFEDVSTPAGEFTDCLKIVSTITLKVLSSAYPGRSVSVKATGTEWYASGIGAVKRISQLQARVPGSRAIESLVVEELVGYAVGEQKKGRIHITIAENVVQGSSDTTYPGSASIASDGNSFLVVYPCDNCLPAGLWGTIISGVGEKLTSFVIPSPIPYPGAHRRGGTAAFDGTNYLIIMQIDGQFLGFRVSPSGTLLDPPEGFLVTINGGLGYTASFGKDNYLVVWGRFVSDYEIYGAIVTPNGQVVNEFPIYEATGEDIWPSVAFDGTNYLVAWQSRYGLPQKQYDIKGTRVNTDGVVLDPDGIIISTGVGIRQFPHLFFDGTNYLTVWEDSRNDLDTFVIDTDIYGTRITTDGVVLDGPPDTGGIPINTAPYPKYHPRVTFDGERYLVVWEVSFYYEPPIGIFTSVVSPAGTVIDYTKQGLGIQVNDPAGEDKFVNPEILFNGMSSLVTYTRMGYSDILGTIIFKN